MKKIFQSLPLLVTTLVCCARAGAQSNTMLRQVSNDARITRMNEKEIPVKSMNTALAPPTVDMPETQLKIMPITAQPLPVTSPEPPVSPLGATGTLISGTDEPAMNRLKQEQVKEPPVTMPALPVFTMPSVKDIKSMDNRSKPIMQQVSNVMNKN